MLFNNGYPFTPLGTNAVFGGKKMILRFHPVDETWV